jgi:hypothetical protein
VPDPKQPQSRGKPSTQRSAASPAPATRRRRGRRGSIHGERGPRAGDTPGNVGHHDRVISRIARLRVRQAVRGAGGAADRSRIEIPLVDRSRAAGGRHRELGRGTGGDGLALGLRRDAGADGGCDEAEGVIIRVGHIEVARGIRCNATGEMETSGAVKTIRASGG